MSRKSLVDRNNKRVKLWNKYSEKRLSLKRSIKDPDLPLSEKYVFINQLNKLPRNSSKVRIRNRCMLTGRGNGVYRRFAVCRHKLRDLVAECLLPGVTKSSW